MKVLKRLLLATLLVAAALVANGLLIAAPKEKGEQQKKADESEFRRNDSAPESRVDDSVPVMTSREDADRMEYQRMLEDMQHGLELSFRDKLIFDRLEPRFREECISDRGRSLDNAGGPDAFGYRYVDNQGGDTATYNWIELRGDPGAVWLTFGSADDAVFSSVPLGLSFPFYGNMYSMCNVSTNGPIQFTTAVTTYTNVCLPTTIFAGPTIFPYWDDLHLNYGGYTNGQGVVVGYKNFGDYWVIEYDSIGHCCSDGYLSAKFELILQANGLITFQYNNLVFGNPAYDSTATIGIQAGGTATSPSLQYSCNLLGLQPVNSLAITFYQTGTGSINGHAQDDSGTPTAGATVRINELGTQIITDNNGDYAFPVVPAGSYTLTCQKHGYTTGTADGVVVDVGQNTIVNFSLVSLGLLTAGATNLPISIADNAVTIVPLEITQSNSIIDLEVMVSITHPYVGDLAIYLTSPGATRVRLFGRRGTSGDNLTQTLFDDEAFTAIAQGTAPFSGSFIPESPLSILDNENILGTWFLTIYDSVALNVGTLDAWEVYVTPGPATTGAISGMVIRQSDSAPVQGILVELLGTTTTRITNSLGLYSMGNTPPGTYEMRFGGGIYTTVTATGVQVTTTTLTTLNQALTSPFEVYASNNVPLLVPPTGTGPGTTLSTLEITGPAAGITDMNVLLNISHPYDTDLDLYLISPYGDVVTLSTDNGAAGDNYLNTLFDDEATTPITAGAPPFTGFFQPQSPLSVLDGENVIGTWTLRCDDDLSGYSGTLNSWELYVSTGAAMNGAIAGTVTRQSDNQPIAGILVELLGTTTTRTTNVLGQYSIGNVQPGTYQVRFSGGIYTTVTVSGVVVTSGNTATVNQAMTSPFTVYASTNVPLPVPPTGTGPGSTLSTLAVTGETAGITDINVLVNITHPYDADLDIYLISPGGETVTLSADNGTSGDNYTNTLFDDEAATPIASGTPPYTGFFRPVGSLGVIDGENVVGTWTLRVDDDLSGNSGTLNAWEIYATTGAYSSGSISGIVTQQSNGQPAPGILVSVQGTPRTRVTDVGGAFAFGNVPAGTYTLTFSGGVYDNLSIPNVVVAAGQNTVVNAAMTSSYLIYANADGPVPITDNSMSVSHIQVPDDFELEGILVMINSITHTFTGDLAIYVTSPQNTVVRLFGRRGGGGDNIINCIFNDNAATPIANGTAPFTGAFIPESPLTPIVGQNAIGQWTLTVYDSAGADVGAINQWSLLLLGQLGGRGTLAGTIRQLSTMQILSNVIVSVPNSDPAVSDTTDATGQYSFLVPVGTWDVTISHAGFCDSILTNVVIDTDQTATRNVNLRNPTAGFNVTSLNHQGDVGQITQAPFIITNGGNCVLHYQIADTSAWLSESPVQGDIPAGGNAQINVSFNGTVVSFGEYQSRILVTHNAANSPYEIPVLYLLANAAHDPASLPTEFALHGNFPNPFNSTTEIRYDLPAASQVTLRLYNVMGQEVRTLISGTVDAGRHISFWNGFDNRGVGVGSGIYLLRMEAADRTFTGKVMLIR